VFKGDREKRLEQLSLVGHRLHGCGTGESHVLVLFGIGDEREVQVGREAGELELDIGGGTVQEEDEERNEVGVVLGLSLEIGGAFFLQLHILRNLDKD
jgi:hypothetical protein